MLNGFINLKIAEDGYVLAETGYEKRVSVQT
jgi:hypothetical protein